MTRPILPVKRPAAAVLGLLTLVACGEPERQPESTAAEILVARTTGLTFLQRDQLDEAQREFERLIELAPEEAIGYANLGLVHLKGGDLGEAERAVRRALEIEPENPDVRLILARIYEEDGRTEEARKELEEVVRRDPEHVRTLYALAELAGRSGTAEGQSRRAEYLRRVVAREPANLAARLQLAETLLRGGEPDEATAQLEELRSQAPSFPAAADSAFREALAPMQAGRTDEALAALTSFSRYFEVTPAYQAAMEDLRGPPGTMVGIPFFTFSHEFSLRVQEEEAVLAALRFTDATDVAGLHLIPTGGGQGETTEERRAVIALADVDGDGDQDLYAATDHDASSERSSFLLRNDLGRFVETTSEANLVHGGTVRSAIFGDYDDDRRPDLYVVRAGTNLLYRNVGDGRFEEVTETAGIAGSGDGAEAAFVDLDLDGDLDIYEARIGINRFYRNNGDGSFLELAAAAGIGGAEGADSRDVAFGDFDDDGDVDLFVVNANGSNALFSNVRQGRFEDVTDESGLAGGGSSGAAAVGDYDGDGYLDLFVTALSGGGHALYRNEGDGTFEADRRSDQAWSAILDLAGLGAVFFDFDNDGHLDLLVVGEPSGGSGPGVVLFRNDGTGGFEEASNFLPPDLEGATGVAVVDYNEDGDLDIFLTASDGRVRLLRNDGANVNHYLKIELVGLGEGSGKNNRFGIGSRVKVRAGDLFQVRQATDPVIHFGLGQRLKADVVRVEWTNGVSQDIYFPGTDQDLLEDQELKGSCPFLYAWNGEEYVFVTDVMWRSALGMPLGIMGAREERSYAPPAASREYLRIPGDLLQARDGVYSLQLTEELWETIYLDEVRLLAIDHPDTVEVYVDERFTPPGPVSLRIFEVTRKRTPVSATDEHGVDLLPAIRRKDDVYASNLAPQKYQGITEIHDLVLDLGEDVRADDLVLFLSGWIFPSDASINVAMSQSDDVGAVFPHLQVLDEEGRWQTVMEDLSIPSGKNKTIVAELSGKFLSGDRRVRIRTNTQVYWDQVFFTTGETDVGGADATQVEATQVDPTGAEAPAGGVEGGLRSTMLVPTAADIHYRGFSRLYRKGGRYGPHWFDYSDVATEPKWRDLEGYYTRYGDVRPLLLEPDDMYVIMNAGDEVTVEFDAAGTPDLPDGWTRTFLIYTVGWIKDGDLNTATGQTVEPLPFHAQSRYPYGPEESYPTDEEHQRYLRTYNTRKVERPHPFDRLAPARTGR